MRRLALLLALPLALAGCTSEGGLGFGSSGTGAIPPYFVEYRDVVTGDYERLYEIPLEHEALSLDVIAILDTRSNGLPVPDAAPASLTLELLGPDGETLETAPLDVQHKTAHISFARAPPGTYFVHVSGTGASHRIEGSEYGASYLLEVEALFLE